MSEELEEIGLTAPEIKLWQALESGEPCVFDPDGVDADRTLRGGILGKILRGEAVEDVKPPKLPRQVQIYGAIISGVLDMADTDSGMTLIMRICHFKDRPDFRRAYFALLDFEESQFETGVNFEKLKTEDHLWLNKIISNGEFTLLGAEIGGQFLTSEARFSNPKGRAINAQGAEIKGGVFLGEVNVMGCAAFNSAKIGGQFTANEAHFSNPKGRAINAQGAEIKGSVFLDEADITGCAAFNRAKIGGQFTAEKGRFSNPKGKAIFAQGAEIKGGVFLTGFPHPPVGGLDFTNAHLGHVVIDDNSYPLGQLRLDGARYPNIDLWGHVGKAVPMEGWLTVRTDEKFGNGFRHINFWQCYNPIKEYLATLPEANDLSEDRLSKVTYRYMISLEEQNKQRKRTPFAYRQFARVLDAHGHEAEARDVRVAAGDAYTQRVGETFKGWRQKLYYIWRGMVRHFIAYGIKPWRIYRPLLAFWLLGFVVFGFNHVHMTPAKERFYLSQVNYAADGETFESYKELSPSITLPKGYPTYSPLIYALDVMLPVVDFAQETHWRPKNTDGWWNWLRIFNRVYLALGWAFSTIAVLGFTGLISDKKDKD